MQHALRKMVQEYVDEHYCLAWLLTGNRNHCVQTLTDALDALDGDMTSETFRGFWLSWARQLVIAAALGKIKSQLRESMLRTQLVADNGLDDLSTPAVANYHRLSKLDLERALLAIDIFPRCVLLLTVFEGFSVQDASSLLNADLKLVKVVQVRALVELARRIGSRYERPDPPATARQIRPVLRAAAA